MNTSGTRAVLLAFFGAGLLACGSPAGAQPAEAPTRILPPGELARKVIVRDLAVNGGDVSGVLVNTSQKTVRDVELLIRYQWLWKNEFKPGEDNPGRAISYTAPVEIPPGGQARFTYRVDPPLPIRSDGEFRTAVEVVGLTEVGD